MKIRSNVVYKNQIYFPSRVFLSYIKGSSSAFQQQLYLLPLEGDLWLLSPLENVLAAFHLFLTSEVGIDLVLKIPFVILNALIC